MARFQRDPPSNKKVYGWSLPTAERHEPKHDEVHNICFDVNNLPDPKQVNQSINLPTMPELPQFTSHRVLDYEGSIGTVVVSQGRHDRLMPGAPTDPYSNDHMQQVTSVDPNRFVGQKGLTSGLPQQSQHCGGVRSRQSRIPDNPANLSVEQHTPCNVLQGSPAVDKRKGAHTDAFQQSPSRIRRRKDVYQSVPRPVRTVSPESLRRRKVSTPTSIRGSDAASLHNSEISLRSVSESFTPAHASSTTAVAPSARGKVTLRSRNSLDHHHNADTTGQKSKFSFDDDGLPTSAVALPSTTQLVNALSGKPLGQDWSASRSVGPSGNSKRGSRPVTRAGRAPTGNMAPPSSTPKKGMHATVTRYRSTDRRLSDFKSAHRPVSHSRLPSDPGNYPSLISQMPLDREQAQSQKGQSRQTPFNLRTDVCNKHTPVVRLHRKRKSDGATDRSESRRRVAAPSVSDDVPQVPVTNTEVETAARSNDAAVSSYAAELSMPSLSNEGVGEFWDVPLAETEAVPGWSEGEVLPLDPNAFSYEELLAINDPDWLLDFNHFMGTFEG
ncbi:MAG: hypothetical protein Q9227_002933 [Pyrenula ochraceoflavens]